MYEGIRSDKLYESGGQIARHGGLKNDLIVGLDGRDIKYLGKTRSGKVHDKRIGDYSAYLQ
ncbi:hypothetical protein [Thiothrix nivea]|uniref:Uncharacterized protein n=1 Tax=Thiothrix nivea (strain ATCC 35100 / DSM 5205 / JP2) TaxID=870187 RepID=A0A656HE76_THINJ|nr:hypothetical protein [Thiothrix nivea]EIJ35401.1 hypothetical protein Thini_2868 [Thiothrix nivea DSM 5205]